MLRGPAYFSARPAKIHAVPQRRHLSSAEVLANPIEAANRFFAGQKPILKTAGPIEQQEILISRTECRLL
jgi:hypothetical protein